MSTRTCAARPPRKHARLSARALALARSLALSLSLSVSISRSTRFPAAGETRLGRGVVDVNRAQDRRAVVRDLDLAGRVAALVLHRLQDLVHALRPERRLDEVGDRDRADERRHASALALLELGLLVQHHLRVSGGEIRRARAREHAAARAGRRAARAASACLGRHFCARGGVERRSVEREPEIEPVEPDGWLDLSSSLKALARNEPKISAPQPQCPFASPPCCCTSVRASS